MNITTHAALSVGAGTNSQQQPTISTAYLARAITRATLPEEAKATPRIR